MADEHLPNKAGKRLNILSPIEIKALYERPEFTDEDRLEFFHLNQHEASLLTANMTLETKVHAIVQLGYFNCKHQFFQFELDDVEADVTYILQRYFPDRTLEKTKLARETKRENQKRVLALTGYQLYTEEAHKQKLLARAAEACRISMNPVFILHEVITLLANEKITLPGYTTLQERIISVALKSEQKRIDKIIHAHVSADEKKQIFKLIEKDEGYYGITIFKKEPKNFKLSAIRSEVAKFNQHNALFEITKRVLPLLGLSQKAISYYASLVEHYTVRGLSRLSQGQSSLWLICFIYERCQRILDNLTTMFIYTVAQYKEAMDEAAKKLLIEHMLHPSEQEVKTARLLRNYTRDDIDTSKTFKTIREEVYQDILAPHLINQIADTLENKKQREKLLIEFGWRALDNLANKYKLSLRVIVKVLPIDGTQHKSLLEAYRFLKKSLNDGKALKDIKYEKFPLSFIRGDNRPYIYNNDLKTIHVERYEFECYRKIAEHTQSYSLSVKDSLRYESFFKSLLPNWQDTKHDVIAKLNRPLLNEPLSQFIEARATPLDARILRINKDIADGSNAQVKVTHHKDGTHSWTLPYNKKDPDINNPIYDKLPKLNILRILEFVNHETKFMRAFTHIKPHYAKSKLDEVSINLSCLAKATNMALLQMAGLSDLSLVSLQTIDENYVRLATLRAANDAVNNATGLLPITHHWNLHPALLHASLDGIKLATERETLLSRYSPKYFGLAKGVTGYFLIANHIAVNATVHGAHEHESHYVFDIAYNNTSDIQPDIFSTDTEGANQLNFLLLELIERLFAPRYRSFSKKMGAIISFGSTEKFKNCLIKPEKKLNEKLIISEEDNIKHMLASLLMGEVSQSRMVAKLSAKKFTNKTKRALWELNAILMTEHLLSSIEDLSFRQAIQAALNRGEAYNQLRRHIESIHGKHFLGTNQTDIEVANECARLLTNCIIYYNAYMLNHLFEQAKQRGDTKTCELLKRFSPVAWRHIHFQGRFDIWPSESSQAVDMDALLAILGTVELEQKLAA